MDRRLSRTLLAALLLVLVPLATTTAQELTGTLKKVKEAGTIVLTRPVGQVPPEQRVARIVGGGVEVVAVARGAQRLERHALATSDIFATVERLRAKGVELLPIPENYYDDLEARIELAPDQIDRLRDANVLYDQEGSAEFFQAYTKSLEGGFFIEIVERRDYRGFGAVNAPIRASIIFSSA